MTKKRTKHTAPQDPQALDADKRFKCHTASAEYYFPTFKAAKTYLDNTQQTATLSVAYFSLFSERHVYCWLLFKRFDRYRRTWIVEKNHDQFHISKIKA